MLHKMYYYLMIPNIQIRKAILQRGRISIKKGNSINIEYSKLKKYCFKVLGNGNSISIRGCHQNLSISISGENNEVVLVGETKTNNTNIVLIGKDCKIIISEGCSIGGGELVCMGKGNFIHIGPNCMFSNEIELWATDSHPIYCNDKPIPINQSKPIIIEEHVWVGKRSIILKGVKIGHDSIVGMGTIVTKDVPCSSLVVGNPSRIVKSGVTWSMDRIHI